MDKGLRLKLHILVVLTLSSLLVPACEPKETSKDLEFKFAVPESWKVVRVLRLDTDNDLQNEWVILYSFDDPGKQAFVPIGGAVYDIVHREPKLPIIYPYHLQAPGWTYLGENAARISVEVRDLLSAVPSETAPQSELLVQNKDENDRVTRASIFRWRDNVPPELRKRTDPHEILVLPYESEASGEWYQCVGMFETTHKIEILTDQVIVWERTDDRSQLARIKTYKPTAGSRGYLNEDNRLVAPESSCLGLAYDVPKDIAQSPYPEKVVMAFLVMFMNTADLVQPLLTDPAKQAWRAQANIMMFGSTAPPSSGPCIKQISYNPTEQTKAEIRSFAQAEDQAITETEKQQVQVTVQTKPQSLPITTEVTTWAEYTFAGQTKQVRTLWQLVQEGNAWKIKAITSTLEND